MYNCVGLNKKNFNRLFEVNNNRLKFNILNKDFVDYYKELNFINQLLIHKKVKLLISNNTILGYIWVSKNFLGSLSINSMYVNEGNDLINNYRLLINSFKSSNFIYNCEKSENNFNVLSEIGFVKEKGTFNMNLKLNDEAYTLNDNFIEFETLKKGNQEGLRCKIQNEVFKNDSRLPLTIDDMFYDEYQNYYYEAGAVFVKYNNQYAGYGQIIFYDNVPSIVNVGVLKEYRGKGLGKQLMIYLLNLLIAKGYNDVNLKVSSDNLIALKMYKSLGFEIIGETFMWKYKK